MYWEEMREKMRRSLKETMYKMLNEYKSRMRSNNYASENNFFENIDMRNLMNDLFAPSILWVSLNWNPYSQKPFPFLYKLRARCYRQNFDTLLKD